MRFLANTLVFVGPCDIHSQFQMFSKNYASLKISLKPPANSRVSQALPAALLILSRPGRLGLNRK